MGSYSNVYPNCVDYYGVLAYLSKDIADRPLNTVEIKGILRREFGITVKTPEEVQAYALSDLRERFRTTPDGRLLVYYKNQSDLGKYKFH